MLLVKSDLIDLARVDKVFDSMQTTSPSAAIIASLDASRALLETEGQYIYESLLIAAKEARHILNALPSIHVIEGDRVDPLKLALNIHDSEITGRDLAERLRLLGVEVESADKNTLVAQITIADKPHEIEQLAHSIHDLLTSSPP